MKIFCLLLLTLILLQSVVPIVLMRSKKEFKVHRDRKLYKVLDMSKEFVAKLKDVSDKLEDMKKSLSTSKKAAFDKIDRALGKLDNAKPDLDEHEDVGEEEGGERRK
jgi:hypothetical protein